MPTPEPIELRQADFVTIDTLGPPGQRTFYLQAAQDDLLVTLIIEKEHAAALSVAVSGLLEQLGGIEDEAEPASMDLIHPVEPLFRVGKLGLGYDQDLDLLVVVAEEAATEETPEPAKVHIWASRAHMAALAHKAAVAVASGRPTCILCGETLEPDKQHVCTRGNGRKHIFEGDEDKA